MNVPRVLLFAALPLLVLMSARAQEAKVRVKVKVDLEAAPDNGIGVARMVKGDAGSLVLVKTKGGRTAFGGVPQPDLDWTLVSLNADNMAVIKTDKPKIVWGEGPVALETIENFDHQFRLIASKPDPENAKLLLLQQVLSPRALTGKAAQIITELPYDRLGKGAAYFAANTAVGFTTVVSADSMKLLLHLIPSGTTHPAGSPVFALLLDKQMAPLWSNTLATDPKAQRVDVLDTRVDKAGAVWYFVRNVTDPDPKTREVLGYSFSLYRLDSAGQQEVKLELSGKDFAQEAGIDVLANGTLVCSGIYSNPEGNRNESMGIFRTTLDAAAMKWTPAKTFPYEKQLVKKDEVLQTNMRLEHVWAKHDGGLFVVTQKSGLEPHTVSNLSGKKVVKTEWMGGPFHIMEIDAAGELKWYKHIDRELDYGTDAPGATISTVFADVLYLFYNDDAANLEKRRAKQPIDPVGSPKDAVMLEFKADGTDKGKVVMKEGYKQAYLASANVWRMGEGRIGTLANEGPGKQKTMPVYIEMSTDQRK
ncbi:MAG: hypothetical protein QM724_10235 [Flavobacteriales bacterium]